MFSYFYTYIFYGDYGLGTKLSDLIFKDVVNKLPMDLGRNC